MITAKVPDLVGAGLPEEERETLVLFLEQMKASLNSAVSNEVLIKEPSELYRGLTVYADGESWNPGSGEGWYTYKELGWYRIADINVEGGWEDLLAPISSAGKRGATSDFDWTDYNGTGIYQPDFAVGEDGIAVFHIGHGIKRNSLMYPHIHWSTDGTNTQPVHWEFNYIFAPRNDVKPVAFSTKGTVTIIATPNGDPYVHYVTEVPAVDAVPAMDVDTIILVQLKRVTNGGTDNTDVIFGHFIDLHFQKENIATPGRAPNFYNLTK